MKAIRLAALLFLVLIAAENTQAQPYRGIVREGLSVPSAILGRNVNYNIYLPEGYDTSDRSYPVVYLLHGFGGNQNDWVQSGEAPRTLDAGIADGSLPPMIVVMPDAGNSWYINNYNGSVRYEDFFVEEFIPAIEKQYRIRSQKHYRGIAGLSMGGFGTFIYALKHPDLFVAAAPIAAAVYTEDQIVRHNEQRWATMEKPAYGPDPGGARRLNEHRLRHSVIRLIDEAPDTARKVRWWIDCGDDDHLYRGNAMLHILMRDHQIPHEYRVRDGGHTAAYWRSGLHDALAFIGSSFRN